MYLRKGEGLAGQTWREGRVRLLTEVPEDYIRITSGLGEAPPRSLLIAPMMLNEETFGIIELASFNEFLPHQVEFIRRVGENIASTLSILQNNARNESLLREAQEYSGQLAAQEEEMRQNMEELQATQEEMSRIQRENELRDALLLESVLFVELGIDEHIQRSNTRFHERLGLSPQEVDGHLLGDVLPLPENAKLGFEQMKQGKLWKSQFEFTHIDGKPIQLEVFGQLTFNADNSPEKYILVFLDHSQAYRHELELQETLARLEEQLLQQRNTED
jgi:PAS domain-containing protein